MALIKKIYTAIIPFPANYGKEGDFLFLDIIWFVLLDIFTYILYN